MIRTKAKTVETIKFKVKVTKTDIENGKCGLPSKCMEKVAIERTLRSLKDQAYIDHHVKIDGGKVTFNLDGFKWISHTPKLAKRSLIKFDDEMEKRAKATKALERWDSKVLPHEYMIEATKLHPIEVLTEADRVRLDHYNEMRTKREGAGKRDKRPTGRLRYRVAGMHLNV